MFTISQIQQAHAKVKSGADFPRYIKDLIKLGIRKYETFVSDGHSTYFGGDNGVATTESKYKALTVVEDSNTEKFKQYLKAHQQGSDTCLE